MGSGLMVRRGRRWGGWLAARREKLKGCGGGRNRGRSRWDQPLGSILD
jgi:hypothetical protein